jgi:diguanylate cyclase (GGDEF)-like protein
VPFRSDRSIPQAGGIVTLTTALRVTVVAALVVAAAAAWGADGYWACVPGALAVAATVDAPRLALLGAVGVVVLAAAIAPPPALIPAVTVPAVSVAVMLGTRTRLERERDAMRRSAHRDPLTGLANRRALGELLRYEIARHSRQRESFVVLALDLDGFKRVNDRFGHDAGDEVLREVAVALEQAVRAQDTVVRLGGDEFCILAPRTDHDSAGPLVARVHESLARAATGVSGLGASIGAALYPDDGIDAAALLAAADAAAIEAKRGSRARRVRRAA